MNRLLPFRAWRFVEELSLAPAIDQIDDAEVWLENPDSVLHLAGFERKSDDRSPFVRYARGAATWGRWTQHGVVNQDSEPSYPVVDGFLYALAPVAALRSSVGVKPAVREHYQRILEGTQIYFEPIVVSSGGLSLGDNRVMACETLTVIGNMSLYQAAAEMCQDFARPGKTIASDYALVAIAPEGWEGNLLRNWIEVSAKNVDMARLTALSPRTEDPCYPQVKIGDATMLIDSDLHPDWLAKLTGALGVTTLNLNLKVSAGADKPREGFAWVLPPSPTEESLGAGEQFPFDSVSNDNVPRAGAILWNLRDFRPE